MREGAGSIRNEAKVWGYRWEGYSHEQLYAHVKGEAKGTAMIESAATTWATFIDGVTQTRGAVERLLAEAGAEWQGGAAQSMAAGVSPLAAWADQAALAGQQSQASLQQVAESFIHTANSMPEPPPAKPTQGVPDNFLGMIAGQTDEDAADQQAQQTHLRAIDLMNGYNTQSQVSSLSTGRFTEPQPIGVNAQVDGGMGRSGGDTIDTSSADDSSGDSGGPGSGGPGGGSPSSGGPIGSSSPAPGGQPGSNPSTGSQSVTQPAQVQTPLAPTPLPGGTPATTPPPTTSHPFAPITGTLNEPGTGRPTSGGPGSRGGGSGIGGRGGMPVAGGSPGGGGVAGRGGVVGTGPLPAEGAGRGGPVAGGRGGAPGAFGPMGGAGAGQKDEDKERTSPEYLRDYNDEYWDNTPPVAPPVIGDEDD